MLKRLTDAVHGRPLAYVCASCRLQLSRPPIRLKSQAAESQSVPDDAVSSLSEGIVHPPDSLKDSNTVDPPKRPVSIRYNTLFRRLARTRTTTSSRPSRRDRRWPLSRRPLIRRVENSPIPTIRRVGVPVSPLRPDGAPTNIDQYYKSLEKSGIGTAGTTVTVPDQLGTSRDAEKVLVAQLKDVFADQKPRKNKRSDATESKSIAKAVKGIKKITASKLELTPITDEEQPPVPRLHHGLDRVLFNPGVYQLQDPRTRIFNFDPYLHKILPVEQFNFQAVQQYETSSKDQRLASIAKHQKAQYYGSTSSMTGMLRHLHFLLSHNRPPYFSMITQSYEVKSKGFSNLTKAPAAVFLRYQDTAQGQYGRYAIDADKSLDGMNIMSLLGHSLEKLLTSPVSEFEQYRIDPAKKAMAPEEPPRNSYHYTKMHRILMRSQLDATDPRLPGTGAFDVKTRAVVSVRAHAFDDHRPGLGYEIKQEFGQWESFEREQVDMLRTTMLSYSLQARMGRMDGIFAAYHNVERIFGFQYFGLEDLDLGLHGQRDRTLGDQEFKLSLQLMELVFEKATKTFPKQTLRMHFEARAGGSFLYVFVEPMTEEEADALQSRNNEKNAKITKSFLGTDENEDVEPLAQDAADWAELRAKVDEDINRGQNTDSEAPTGTSEEQDGGFESKLREIETEARRIHYGMRAAFRFSKAPGQLERSQVKTWRWRFTNIVSRLQKMYRKVTMLYEGFSQEQEYSPGFAKLKSLRRETHLMIDALWLKVGNIDASVIYPGTRNAISDLVSLKYVAEKQARETTNAQAEEAGTTNTDKPLLALTLTIRNKVNNEPVTRPENLTADDIWTVEYQLGEVADGRQAWALYEACQHRRADILDRDQETAHGLRQFQQEVAKWAVKGKEWRAKREKEESGKEARVFEPFDKSG